MSKLSNIEQSLKTNPKVRLVQKALDGFYSDLNHEFSQTRVVHYVVAPKKGAYTKESLQKFMGELVPKEIGRAYSKKDFSEDDSCLKFGYLYFREEDVEEITDNFTKNKLTEIIIYPFPSKAFAEDVLKKKVAPTSVKKEVLNNYKSFHRLFNSRKSYPPKITNEYEFLSMLSQILFPEGKR
ncbi:hypothetical protein KAT80_02600 [Candidatus Pacearchaeota archaeon]|nr:hypothetical protein [Candidatus Pacearchaeota archaeon]